MVFWGTKLKVIVFSFSLNCFLIWFFCQNDLVREKRRVSKKVDQRYGFSSSIAPMWSETWPIRKKFGLDVNKYFKEIKLLISLHAQRCWGKGEDCIISRRNRHKADFSRLQTKWIQKYNRILSMKLITFKVTKQSIRSV